MKLYNAGVLLGSQDSLAAEIEGTMRRELSVEEDSAFQEQRYNRRLWTETGLWMCWAFVE